jgi:hypothetical protein
MRQGRCRAQMFGAPQIVSAPRSPRRPGARAPEMPGARDARSPEMPAAEMPRARVNGLRVAGLSGPLSWCQSR